MTIHWCGTGLSSVPGLRGLVARRPVVVWNRTVKTARDAVGDLTDDVRPFDLRALGEALSPGDVIVSMLPADKHAALARAAIEAGANFISSSYLADDILALDEAAESGAAAVVGEVGLDPGLDHVLAYDLVARAREVGRPGDRVSFLSYCGGVPAVPNPFRYKFSWSPLGVLRALRSPSRAIRDGAVVEAARPWDALDSYRAPLPEPETFEVYPNRDSTRFIDPYGLDPAWKIRDFVRGTLRLDGWAAAWSDVFDTAESADAKGLEDLAGKLWAAHAYDPGEPDRVVLCVSLSLARDGEAIFDQTWTLDALGDARGSAMARLVSEPVALAAELASDGLLAPGVQPAPAEPDHVARFVEIARSASQHLARVDHLA